MSEGKIKEVENNSDTSKKAKRSEVGNEHQLSSNPQQEPAENLPDLHVDPEFRDMLPRLAEGVYAALEKKILDRKDEQVVTTDQHNTIIDGHHTHKICTEHGIRFFHKVILFDSREETKEWIRANQLARRNLTKFQRAEQAAQSKPALVAQAKANQQAAGGAVPQKSAEPLDVREELAKLAEMSTDTYSKVEYILEHADEKTKEELRRGESGTSINKVYQKLKAQNEPKTPDDDSNAPISPNGQPVKPAQKSEKKRDCSIKIDNHPALACHRQGRLSSSQRSR